MASLISTLFWINTLYIAIQSVNINVYIYDPSLETTDESSAIASDCGCSGSDIVSTFSESWSLINNKIQITPNIENINFYFMSDLIIDYETDINNEINNLLTSNSSNFNSAVSFNFECGKSLSIFNTISWNINDQECMLTFDSISSSINSMDTFISFSIDSIIQTTSINDITININTLSIKYNDINSNDYESYGILLQTANETNINTINTNFIFNNLIIEGNNNIPGSLIHISSVGSLAITSCEFYGIPQGILTSNDVVDVSLNNIMINNARYESDTVFGAVIDIMDSDTVTMDNINSVDCTGEAACFEIQDVNTLDITSFECISCNGYAGSIYAVNIVDVDMNDLNIVNNTGTNTIINDVEFDSMSAGIYLNTIHNTLRLGNSNFMDNYAEQWSVIYIRYCNIFYLTNNMFVNNTIHPLELKVNNYGEILNNSFISNSDARSGGAISLDAANSNTDNIYKINDCKFINNRAEKFGGAIMNQYAKVTINNSIFDGNKADIGGSTAYIDWSSSITYNIVNSIFKNNVAYSSGGAIYIFSGEYTLNNVQCIENQAKISGGCLHDANGFLDCSDANPVRTEIIDSQFYRNKARQAAVGYLTSCFFTMKNSKIINNTAYIQGGGFVVDSTTISDLSNYTEQQYLISNVLFEGNYGGLSGGAMILTGGDILISDNTIFNKNEAGSKGGAILIQGIDEWDVKANINNSLFENNLAENGGALLIETIQLSSDKAIQEDNANLKLSECTLTSNTGINGGALYVSNGHINMNQCELSNNIASDGGALYYEGGVLNDNNSIFNNNYAEEKGGAAYIFGQDIMFTDTEMNNNNAKLYGGGLYFGDVILSNIANGTCILTNEFSENVKLNENDALLSGTGYYFEITDVLEDEYSDDSCNTTSNACQWCNDCTMSGNITSGNNVIGTEAYKMNVDWNDLVDGSVINRATSIEINAEIVDFLCELVHKFESDVTLSVSITTEDNSKYPLVLDGSILETFYSGKASLVFNALPKDDTAPFIQSNVEFSVLLTVISSLQNNDVNGLSDGNATEIFAETTSVIYSNQLYELPDHVVILGVMLGGISLLSVIITAILTRYYISEPIITGANVYFLFIILGGIGMGSISVIFLPFVPMNIDCRVLLWFIHLSFVLTVAPLAGKTWRIWIFFYYYQGVDDKGNSKEFKWTTTRLAIVFVLIPLSITIIYLIIWSLPIEYLGNNWNLIYLYYEDIFVIVECPFNSIFYTISYVICCLLLLILIRLAISTRKVPRNFNESFWLGACIYTICILIIFMIPISLVDTINTSTRKTFSIIAAFVVIQSMLLFLFWVKLFKIKGWFKSDKFSFMNHAKSSRDRSKQSRTDRSRDTSKQSRTELSAVSITNTNMKKSIQQVNLSDQAPTISRTVSALDAKNKILNNMTTK